MQKITDHFDIAVIGAGHAGAEAALAAARLGSRTALFTMSLDAVCNLPCNPSIGGTAKGHLVREIDALGGEMGKAADACTIQSRMLNRGKGPAVHSLRAQVDRAAYGCYMKSALEHQPNLELKQAEIVDILCTDGGVVCGIVTAMGACYGAKAVIICTGTFMRGKIFVGDIVKNSGPDGLHASEALYPTLERLGLTLRRFKTGTPARVHNRSIDFSKLEEQPGDEPVTPFSFADAPPPENRALCHIAYTNEGTHDIIRANIERSAMFSGNIHGTGARYCPSIEDKVVRFADKTRHQVFVEPVGMDSCELYLQGMSTSLPTDVQREMYRSVSGFERIEIMRDAYAIEYDCIDPTTLDARLQCKNVPGLYGAGQFNGTSGYEEAAAQGLVAGINAHRQVHGLDPVIFSRAQSYIGTLIDDLVTKGCMDPYRMMTSRSEYRLLLRQDNADERLTPLGHELGLIDEARMELFHVKQFAKANELRRIATVTLPPSDALSEMLVARGTSPTTTGATLLELLRRPQISYDDLAPFDPQRPTLDPAVAEAVQIEVKYAGYIAKQQDQVRELARQEQRLIPRDIDYSGVRGLRLEAVEKLSRIQPHSIGQAGRISGVSPADITVLLVYLAGQERGRTQ